MPFICFFGFVASTRSPAVLRFQPTMTPKYLTTLTIAVVLITFAAASLQFVTRSQVLSGKAVDETLPFEFTIDADRSHTYEINPDMAQFLQTHIGFHTEGPPRVIAAKVEVMPKSVSWTENRSTTTAPGAAMTIQLRWDTSSSYANGSRGSIYLDFPEIPGLEGKTTSFHSGGYQIDSSGRYVIREVTTYQSTSLLSLARFVFALSAGLPFGILLHTMCWAFVLRGEKRSRISEFPPQGAGSARTFYPNPVAEWTVWLFALGIGSFVASMMAGFSILDGFMSSFIMSFTYGILAIAGGVALLAAYLTRRSLLTVRVGPDGIAYARGRGDLQWQQIARGEIRQLTQKSRTYRGNTSYWIEIEFNDNRKKLKIGQSIVDYPALRDLLTKVSAG